MRIEANKKGATMNFEKDSQQGTTYFKLSSDLTGEVAESLASSIRKDLDEKKEFNSIIFDLQDYALDYKAFKFLSPLGLELRRLKRQIYLLSTHRSVHNLIRSEGMGQLLKIIHSTEDIHERVPLQPAKTKVDVGFINPFIEGTVEVLSVQCSVETQPASPILKGTEEIHLQTDIAGIIGITSETFNGSISLCFSEETFLKIMSSMLGEEFKEISKDLEDGAGELLNMIFGHAKRVLNQNGHSFEKALPTVVRASNLSVHHTGGQSSILLPFTSSAGSFFMEISTENL